MGKIFGLIDAPFTPFDADGNAVAEKEMHTAGKPYAIILEADRSQIKADGKGPLIRYGQGRRQERKPLPYGRQPDTVQGQGSRYILCRSQRKSSFTGVLPESSDEGLQRHDDSHCSSDGRAGHNHSRGHIKGPEESHDNNPE